MLLLIKRSIFVKFSELSILIISHNEFSGMAYEIPFWLVAVVIPFYAKNLMKLLNIIQAPDKGSTTLRNIA